jgi:hypothetical protein
LNDKNLTYCTFEDLKKAQHKHEQHIFFGEILQKTDFVRPEADILSQIPRFLVDEFAKEDEIYG